MKKKLSLSSLLVIASMTLVACGGAAPVQPAATQPPAAATEAPAAEPTAAPTEAPAAEPTAAPTEAPAAQAPADANALPRKETLYFNGQQWGPVVGWNPYSNSNNNGMAIAQQDNARVTMFETPYVYNMLDGKVYPSSQSGRCIRPSSPSRIRRFQRAMISS